MNDQSVDPKVAARLLQVLLREMSDDPAGQEILARFQKAPKEYSQALADYLRDRLDDDETFRERLAEAQEIPAEMQTIISGGHVKRLVQIAQAGIVVINQGIPLGRIILVILAVIGVLVAIPIGYFGESEISKILSLLFLLPAIIGLGGFIWSLLSGDTTTDAPPPEKKKKPKRK